MLVQFSTHFLCAACSNQATHSLIHRCREKTQGLQGFAFICLCWWNMGHLTRCVVLTNSQTSFQIFFVVPSGAQPFKSAFRQKMLHHGNSFPLNWKCFQLTQSQTFSRYVLFFTVFVLHHHQQHSEEAAGWRVVQLHCIFRFLSVFLCVHSWGAFQ